MCYVYSKQEYKTMASMLTAVEQKLRSIRQAMTLWSDIM